MLKELKAKGEKAFIYGINELDGLGMVFVLPGELKDYTLPKKPKVTAAAFKKIEELLKPYRDKGKLNPSVVRIAWAKIKKRYHIV